MPAAVVVILTFVVSGSAFAQTVDRFTAAKALQHYQAGREHFQREHWDQAERQFAQAVRLDPMLTVAHYDLGRTYMALRRYTSAVRAYLGARDAYKRLNALAAGQRAADRAREQESRVRANTAFAERPQAAGDRPPVALRERENRAQESGEPRWTPEEPPAELWLALGSAYLRLGHHDDAERQYRAAIAANPALGEAHNNLGVLCLMKGQLDEAARELALAERAGYRVSAGLKAELAARRR
jgi:Tfp pilus assembly protein PilF